jgi:xanthine dehydrogenase accessory factor
VRCPAGLDLGPSSQEEIAVAILAELVAWRHTKPASTAALVGPAEAVDPVCGMTVSIAAVRELVEHDGHTYYFCGAGCRSRFEADPARYLATA